VSTADFETNIHLTTVWQIFQCFPQILCKNRWLMLKKTGESSSVIHFVNTCVPCARTSTEDAINLLPSGSWTRPDGHLHSSSLFPPLVSLETQDHCCAGFLRGNICSIFCLLFFFKLLFGTRGNVPWQWSADVVQCSVVFCVFRFRGFYLNGVEAAPVLGGFALLCLVLPGITLHCINLLYHILLV
jgi:hypothetical protein